MSPRDVARPTPGALVGRALGDFVVRGHLAAGSHGDVWLAEQPALGREAVIKVARGRGDAARTQRFLREARLASRLDHPYAAHVYSFGAEPDGLLWIAMERVRGQTLADAIGDGPLALDRLVPLLERICEVVHTAHDQGIVHRDLKPANIMVVARAGRLLPKLLDLGVARTAVDEPDAAGPEGADAADPALTQRGDIVGSPAFMAPEQWFDPAGVDRRTDVYALGAVIYCALTGAPPFAGTPREVARAHAQQAPPSLGPAFPAALDAVLARALAKRRDDRFDSALALAAAVRAAMAADAPALPALAPAVRDAVLGGAPAPIADALARYDAARDAAAGLAALAGVITASVRWLAVLALAGRARHGEWSAEASGLLAQLRAGPLDDARWLALARAAIGPPALFPLPELADAITSPALAAAVAAPAVAGRAPAGSADRAAVAASADARPAGAASGDAGHALAAVLEARLGVVERVLRALGIAGELPVVVRRGEVVERWTGTRRRQRALASVSAAALGPDAPAVLDADGGVLLALAPFAVVAAPTLGAEPELFLLDRGAPGGAVYVAFPSGYEHRDDPWPALGAALPVAGDAASAVDDAGPYRGLEPFRAADAAWFFGRDAEADAAANRLRASGVLAVVGPSGAGKSSFVLAGVVPRLADRPAVVLRPGAHPARALAALDPPAGSLIVVDQLEELISLAADPAERARFADALGARVAAGAWLAVTVRDDFLLRVVAVGGLRAQLEPAVQLLATPSRDQLRRIVVEPARRAGYAFDDDALPDAMVDAVADHPGALPLLSFTAAHLWRARDRHLRQLTRRAYDALGGVAGALAGHADAVVDAIAAAPVVRDVFRNLATAEGTRAALTRAELDQVVGAGAADVVDRLVDARLLVTTEDAAGERVELVHEALLEAWPRLRQWRRDDAEVARLRDQLRAAARQWEDRGRPDGLLWRGDALDEYRLWRPRYAGALTGREDAFAAASLADAARARRRRRQLYGGALAALAAAVAALLVVAAQARESRALAEASRRAAEARTTQLFVEQGRSAVLADDGQRAYLYLREATRRGATDPGVAAMRARASRLVLTERAAAQAAAPIYTVAWRPDGAGFATAGADGTVELWRADGTRTARLRGHDRVVWLLAWSPDGRRLVSAGEDNVPRLWDAERGALIAALRGHRTGAGRARENHGLAISPDGRWIASASWAGDALVWDGATGALVARLAGHAGAVHAVAFADPRTLVTTDDRAVRLWTLDAAGARAGQVIDEPTGAVRWVAIGAGGLIVATAQAGAVRVIDPARGAVVRTLATHEGARPPAVDGDQVITVGAGDELRAWRLDGARRWDAAPGGPVSAMALGGARLATGGTTGELRVWDRATGRAAITHRDFHQKVWATAISPAGDAIVATDLGGAIRVYAARGVDELARARRTAFALDFLADRLVSVGPTGIDRDLGGDLARAAGPDLGGDLARAAGPELGGDLARAAGPDLGGDLARAAGPELDARTPLAGVQDAALAGDGSALVLFADGRARRLDRAGVERDGPDVGAAPPIAISRDGQRAALTDRAGAVTLWQVAGWRRLATLAGHTAPVVSIAFDPAGGRLVTCSEDRTARVWSARDGAALATLAGHDARVVSARFAGDRLITASSDRTWRVWSLAPPAPLAVTRNVEGEILAVAVAGDGRIATGGEGGVVIWSPAGAVLAHLLPEAIVQSLAWRPDGARLAAGTGTGTADDGDVVTLDTSTAPGDPAAVDCRLRVELGADERAVDRVAPPACPALRY
jgi:WD40 repeat protein